MVVGSDDEEQCTQDREICQQLFFFDEEGQSPKVDFSTVSSSLMYT